MARKKKEPERINHHRWLVSYADFITLLFAFFVVMFAGSNSDQRKVGRIAEAVQVAFKELAVFDPASKAVPLNGEGGTVAPVFTRAQLLDAAAKNADMKTVRGQLEEVLKDESQNKLVHISEDSRGVTVSLAEAGFFDSGSADVKEAGLPVLRRIGEKLRQLPQNLRVEGHTDNTPIHTAMFPSNWELSTARATNVLQYLINDARIPAPRLSAAGYGEYRPGAPNTTAEGRGANRRVDLVIIGPAAEKLEPTEAR